MAAPGPRILLGQIARHSAAALFAAAVVRIYEDVTGEKAKAPVVGLLQRLADEERLTPEAILHLLAAARALERAGARLTLLGRPILDLFEVGPAANLQAAAAEVRERLITAPEGFERLIRLGGRLWGQDPQRWHG